MRRASAPRPLLTAHCFASCEQDEAAIKVAEIRQNSGPAIMPQEDTGATSSRAAKPRAPVKQQKKDMTALDIAGYAEMLNGRFASAALCHVYVSPHG